MRLHVSLKSFTYLVKLRTCVDLTIGDETDEASQTKLTHNTSVLNSQLLYRVSKKNAECLASHETIATTSIFNI